MTISTFEGVVKNGQILLTDSPKLPELAKVYVVVPDVEAVTVAHVHSPRLAHPEQAADFAKQVIKVTDDAEL